MKIFKWKKTKDKKQPVDKKVSLFLQTIILKRNQRSSAEEKIVKFFVWIALRIAIRPHHWKDKRKNKEIIIKAYKKIVSKDFVFIPPAFTFYLIMAFMPIMSLLLFFLKIWPKAGEFATKTIEGFVNIDIQSISEGIISGSTLTIISSVGFLLVSTWIASAGFAKFVFTESHLYNHKKFGGFWMNRLRGSSIVCSFAIYLTLGLFAFTLIPVTLEWMGLSKGTTIYSIFFYLANGGGGFLFLYTGFVLLFKFSPRFKLTWRQVHPGAVVATIPTLLFVMVFSILSKFLFNYAKFGILAPMMTLAAVLFIFSYFIYVGLITNASFYKVHHSLYTISKTTVSKK